MKGLSIVLTVALLVLAHQLAWRLSRAGATPEQKESTPNRSRTLGVTDGINRASRQSARLFAPGQSPSGLTDSSFNPNAPVIRL